MASRAATLLSAAPAALAHGQAWTVRSDLQKRLLPGLPAMGGAQRPARAEVVRFMDSLGEADWRHMGESQEPGLRLPTPAPLVGQPLPGRPSQRLALPERPSDFMR